MAVSLQTASVASWAGTLDSTAPYGHNVPVTVADGINRILIVLVGGYNSAYTATFDGVAMTLGAHTSMVDAATHAGLFYMINPPVGTYNVSVNDASWQGHNATVTAFVLDGVDQTTPFGASSTSENPYGGSPTSASLTSASDGALVSILSVYSGSEPSIVANPGTALTAQLSNTSNFYSRSSYILGAATSIGFTFGGSGLQTGLVAVVVNAASGGNAAPTTITATLGNVVGSITSTGSTTNGTFTSEVLKDYAGNVLANTALNFVRFYNDTTGALVLNKTGVSTNGSGIVTFSDAALVAGTTYRVDWETAAGSRRMPRKAAA